MAGLDIQEIDQNFDKTMQECNADMSLTTSVRIIKARIEQLNQSVSELRGYKQQAIQNDVELHANLFLYMQLTAQTIRSIFITFHEVKAEKNLEAWMSLIDAYEYSDVASRTLLTIDKNPEESVLGAHAKLKSIITAIEHGIFPEHNVYNSPGLIETIGDCSVCRAAFLDCDHVEGRIYSGVYCMRVNRTPLDLEHSSIVKNPRDRRCIITSRRDSSGQAVDVFSREPIEDLKDPNTFSGLLLSLHGLEIN